MPQCNKCNMQYATDHSCPAGWICPQGNTHITMVCTCKPIPQEITEHDLLEAYREYALHPNMDNLKYCQELERKFNSA